MWSSTTAVGTAKTDDQMPESIDRHDGAVCRGNPVAWLHGIHLLICGGLLLLDGSFLEKTDGRADRSIELTATDDAGKVHFSSDGKTIMIYEGGAEGTTYTVHAKITPTGDDARAYKAAEADITFVVGAPKQINSPLLRVGNSRTIQPGADGIKTLTYVQRTVDGEKEDVQLLGEKVTLAPVTETIDPFEKRALPQEGGHLRTQAGQRIDPFRESRKEDAQS